MISHSVTLDGYYLNDKSRMRTINVTPVNVIVNTKINFKTKIISKILIFCTEYGQGGRDLSFYYTLIFKIISVSVWLFTFGEM